MHDPLASPPPTATPAASEAALHASLESTLSARPAGPRAGVWLFVYGSMAGDPPFEPAEVGTARLRGWNRAFCVADPAQRGEPGRPGLVLGLIPGEGCEGVAFRIGEVEARGALIAVWRREMLYPFYRAAWTAIELASGGKAHAIAFFADETGPLFRPGQAPDAVAAQIAAARGPAGSNLAYLTETTESLGRHGVRDPMLDDLARRAAAVHAVEPAEDEAADA